MLTWRLARHHYSRPCRVVHAACSMLVKVTAAAGCRLCPPERTSGTSASLIGVLRCLLCLTPMSRHVLCPTHCCYSLYLHPCQLRATPSPSMRPVLSPRPNG
jgi:hypothetical protein